MNRQNWKPGNMLYPVPAVMVGCSRLNEKPNIITIAWAGTICSSPPMLSISIRPERYSYDIIKDTGEFTVNLVTPELTKAADFCGVRSGRQVDKFELMNLTPTHSQFIQAPGIAESPVILECKVKQIIRLGSHDLFMAEVVNVSVKASQIDEQGKFHLNQMGLVAYSHGQYFSLGKKLGKFGYSVQKKEKLRSNRNREDAGRSSKHEDGQGQKGKTKRPKPKCPGRG
ncbi:flavin reductase family protein [Clostridiales bacterium COT073_COT-073]|nr:flavin reductase family protein [Clostridiales bacterium COT073_COT-073]